MGWYLVAILISLWYASPYIREKFTSWKRKKDEHEYAAKYHKNPDLLHERLSAVEASRQKMQEEYRQKALIAQEQEKERKEKKKEETAKLLEKESGSRRLGNSEDSSSRPTGPKSHSFRQEYNPLMGDGSRGYRPPKRTCCGKGGCG